MSTKTTSPAKKRHSKAPCSQTKQPMSELARMILGRDGSRVHLVLADWLEEKKGLHAVPQLLRAVQFRKEEMRCLHDFHWLPLEPDAFLWIVRYLNRGTLIGLYTHHAPSALKRTYLGLKSAEQEPLVAKALAEMEAFSRAS